MSVSELREVFKGRSVLVTGHTGFKGSWLCFILNMLGAKVHGYSLERPADPRHSFYALDIAGLLENPKRDLGDVRDRDQLKTAFVESAPDFVFHLAAQPIVSASYTDPYRTFSTNIVGVLNTLELLRVDFPHTTSVIITSDKCYKNKERLSPYLESDEMGGDDPYSASKGAAELVIHSYLTSYPKMCAESGVASVRAGNVFGGGDWSLNRLVPDCARDIFEKGTVDIRMPAAIRPWTFVVDILFGYLILAARLRKQPRQFRGSWNFASGETRTVEQVVELLIRSLGTGRMNVSNQTAFGKEAGLLLIDPAKARTQLGWECLLSVDDALHETASWYRRQRSSEDMVAYSKKFIEETYLHRK